MFFIPLLNVRIDNRIEIRNLQEAKNPEKKKKKTKILRTFIQSKVAHGLTHGWPPPQVIRPTGQLREAWPTFFLIIHPKHNF